MIDIHCHILPGADDGAQSLTESLAMAQEAADQGVRKIIATPDYQHESHLNPGKGIVTKVAELNETLQKEGITVDILPGHIAEIDWEIVQHLKQGEVIPLNETSGYVLLKLPAGHIPGDIAELLFELQIAGYKPIIAHPERSETIRENPDQLYQMVKRGALTQVAATSVIGKAGKKTEKFTHQLLAHHLAHFVGSSAYHTKKRGSFMSKAFTKISKIHGKVKQYQLMENSEALLIGNAIHADRPERIIPRKKLWNLVF